MGWGRVSSSYGKGNSVKTCSCSPTEECNGRSMFTNPTSAYRRIVRKSYDKLGRKLHLLIEMHPTERQPFSVVQKRFYLE